MSEFLLFITENPYLFAISITCYPISCPLEQELHRGQKECRSAALRMVLAFFPQCKIKNY